MAENFPDLILNDGSRPLEANKNDYFLVTITDLLPGKTYPVEFRWNKSDATEKPDWGAVLKIVTPGYTVPSVTNVVAAWEGTTFTVAFTSNPSSSGNINLSHYNITLVASDNTTRVFRLEPVAGSTQKFSFSRAQNLASFVIPQSAFSGNVISVDKDGNQSTPATFNLTTRTSRLPAPVITATAYSGGYTVSYTTPNQTTYPEYDHIEIEEVESNSSTDPGTGYAVIFSGLANPATISTSNTNKRWIRARFWDNGVLGGPYSTAVSAEPIPAVVIDTTPPAAPTSGTLTPGIDNTSGATVGFNAYADISWTAVSDSTLRGYRIRFRRSGTSDFYSYVDSPGTGTTYRLSGLSIGTLYEVGIASYDQFNNTTSAYTSLGTVQSTGTPFVGVNVTTRGYFEAQAGGESGSFRFGYGVESGRRGLRFDTNNYWYIDSTAAASFRLGGASSNYLQWNGGTFTIDGNITARGGTFQDGNVQITTGGLYAGASATSGARLAISSSGLTAFSASSTSPTNGSLTNIYSTPTVPPAGGTAVSFATSSANIGGWVVSSSSIAKTQNNGTLTLDSTNARIIVSAPNSTYTAGLYSPVNNLTSDVVIFAGDPTPASAPFRVTAGGALTATNATITGAITATSGSFTGSITSTTGSIGGWSINPSTISGGSTTLNSNGTISITSGTKTTTISNSASISLVDTSTGFLTGGALSIQSGSEFASLYATGLAVGTGSLFSNKLAPEYPTDALILATTGPEIHIGSSGGSAPIYFNFRVNNLSNSISTGAYTTDETSDLAGTFIGPSGVITARRFGATPMFSHRTSGNGRVITFYLNGSGGGGIDATAGGTPQFAAASDYRLKENIVDYIDATSRIKAARLRKFNLKEIPGKEFVGFIAHEFAEVDPEFVTGEKDAVDEDGNPIYQSIGTTNMIYYLTGALKESIIKIEELEARLDALEV